jgi:phosphoribosylformimino-5-aminoimidazole carboxamide ribonucleotide (ProFAR) isomerase
MRGKEMQRKENEQGIEKNIYTNISYHGKLKEPT